MLSKNELLILKQLEDGNADLEKLSLSTGLDEEMAKKILSELENMELIKLTKNFDTGLMTEKWYATTSEKGKEALRQAKN